MMTKHHRGRDNRVGWENRRVGFWEINKKSFGKVIGLGIVRFGDCSLLGGNFRH